MGIWFKMLSRFIMHICLFFFLSVPHLQNSNININSIIRGIHKFLFNRTIFKFILNQLTIEISSLLTPKKKNARWTPHFNYKEIFEDRCLKLYSLMYLHYFFESVPMLFNFSNQVILLKGVQKNRDSSRLPKTGSEPFIIGGSWGTGPVPNFNLWELVDTGPVPSSMGESIHPPIQTESIILK